MSAWKHKVLLKWPANRISRGSDAGMDEAGQPEQNAESNHPMMPISDLSTISKVVWQPQRRSPQKATIEPNDIAIITAFFDIGRGQWTNLSEGAPRFKRSNETYISWFGNMASIPNHIVVFTEPRFVKKVLHLREIAGHKNATTILEITNLFESDLLADWYTLVERTMNQRFKRFVWQPDHPECRVPAYDVVTMLKPIFVTTAIQMGLVKETQAAWIDFGYGREGEAYSPKEPWRFDCERKMNLFVIRQLDHTPIFQIVRSGQVYFHGAVIVGPVNLWGDYAADIFRSFVELLSCGMVDDDQTLQLMVYRRDPSRFHNRNLPMDRMFGVIELFRCGLPAPEVKLPSVSETRILPAWLEEPYTATKKSRLLRSMRNFQKLLLKFKTRGS